MVIIGREKEQSRLSEILHSNTAEFIALYGRRRVGKTYLVRTFLKQKKCLYFQLSGEKKAKTAQQLKNFSLSMAETFYDKNLVLQTPASWHDAFQLLTRVIQEKAKKNKIVLFFDELPWLASQKSNFLSALDYYWNRYWVEMPNLKLIVCGSAASWMIKHIVRNKGGLHNRLTGRIRLEPFNLKETQQFLKEKYPNLNHIQLLQIFFVMGGIPYYLKLLDARLSITQNIDQLFFTAEGELLNEFDELFSSLFSSANAYEEIVSVLAKHPHGLARKTLLERLKLSSDGGNFNKKISALIEAGFVKEFGRYGESERATTYKLIDEYSSFYLQWVLPKKKTIERIKALPEHWQTIVKSGEYYAWRGQVFEMLCCQHLLPICKAAAIKPVNFVGSWSAPGAQIDLILDRDDDTTTLCEIKCTDKPFVITKKYAEELRNKMNVFRESTKTKKHLILVLLSAHGIEENSYAKSFVNWCIDLDDILKNC